MTMKLTLEQTSKIVTLEVGASRAKVPARIWIGKTESGTPVHCFITRVAVSEDATPEQIAEFERALKEMPRATIPQEIEAIPLRLII